MRVAIPLFGTRVAPRCTGSESVLLAIVENEGIRSRSIHHLGGTSIADHLAFLSELDIEVIVCGAASQSFREEASGMGVSVVTDVSGEADEVLGLLVQGKLLSGHGLGEGAVSGKERGGVSLDSLNCIECIDRVCLHGGDCIPGLSSRNRLEKSEQVRKSMEVACDVALEKDRKLCRIAELVYFCLGMDYHHVGVAFCVDMFREAEILVGVLQRFFQVSAVCCKVGGITTEETGIEAGEHEVLCNALGQAEVLNARQTDFNIIVGLCVGCDTLFTRNSVAPVSTLFVKDKMLANNPVSALYSKYYLEDLAREI